MRRYAGRTKLKDIAERTGYSINTVSRALRNKDDIGAETRQYIKRVSREMGYIPNTIARSLRSNSTKTIAVVLGDISNPYFGIVVKGVENKAKERGYHVLIANTDECYDNEHEAVKTLAGKHVDGMIILPVQTDYAYTYLLQDLDIPFVFLGRYFKNLPTSYVVSDDVKGGYLATKHLIEKGHEKILVITGPSHLSCAHERLQGYIQAMGEANLEISPSMICRLSSIRGSECYSAFLSLLKKREFTAVFAFSDFLAFQVLYTLEEVGIRCPESVAVVGYDNVQKHLIVPRPLTTIDIPIYDMAQKATEMLLDKIENENSSMPENDQIIYDVSLLKRTTT